ncbi:hypothetical protein LCGC14_0736320 [marine sediment metagenome]|uniref:Uncharacterized protein n=1 Tax=marine sediment metagenome TaxID=412755 RepID=A0A0F9QC71_9ZZZZ
MEKDDKRSGDEIMQEGLDRVIGERRYIDALLQNPSSLQGEPPLLVPPTGKGCGQAPTDHRWCKDTAAGLTLACIDCSAVWNPPDEVRAWVPMHKPPRSPSQTEQLEDELDKLKAQLARLKADRVSGWVWCSTCVAAHVYGKRRRVRDAINADMGPDPECAPHRWRALFAGGYLEA